LIISRLFFLKDLLYILYITCHKTLEVIQCNNSSRGRFLAGLFIDIFLVSPKPYSATISAVAGSWQVPGRFF
jgi:hypothetical protein